MLRMFRATRWFFLLLTASGLWHYAQAQVSGPPTADCHITDGKFDTCPNGTMEWSDVQPVPFPSSGGFLYVNQDAQHKFLWLLYDFTARTTPIAATDSVHVSFDTVSTDSGTPALEEYDVYIFGSGQFQVLEQGKPIPPGTIVGASGFGVSPSSSTPHLIAELQVPLTAVPPTSYSPDPLFWSATIPPTPPPPPCPTAPGKTFNDCVKKYASIGGTITTLGGIAAGVAAGLCTAGTIGGCAPAEVALIIGGGVSAAVGYLLDKYVANDPPDINLTIPPDPNYTQIATPAMYTYLPPEQGVPPNQATAINAYFVTMEEIIALEQAGITSIARAEGATQAGNAFWFTQQTTAAQGFAASAGALFDSLPGLLTNLTAAFQASGAQLTFTANDVRNFQAAITPSAPSSEIGTEFALALQALTTQLGFSSSDAANVLTLMLEGDPQSAGLLGTGAFPASLSDSTLLTDLTQLGTSLAQNLPSTTGLTQSFSVTLAGDYVAAGAGLRGGTAPDFGPPPASAPITITGIPTGATVLRAFLYWGMLDNGLELSLQSLKLNGNAVTGSLIGAGPDTCWGRQNSFTFRADVTPLVTGNGTYTITDFATGGNILGEGASLVVIYQLAGAPTKTIIIEDGNVSMPSGVSTSTATFSGFDASSPVTALTTFMVGDGQEPQFGATNVSFTGSLGTIKFPGLFASNDGPLWDTDNFNVSSAVGAGSSSDSANITITSDCVLWSAQAFSVTSSPVTTPVTQTAAIVQANANGNTVANVVGLSPSSAPTIQDQIQFVVQNRVIQNPGTDASSLTDQLVTGLVNDGIISSTEASSIESAVLSKVVPPAGVPAISGSLSSSSLTSSTNTSVIVTLTDTGTGNAVATGISQITFKTLTGSGNVTLNSPAVPIAVGNIAVGKSATVQLFLNIPATVKRFTITETGPVLDVIGRPYQYSTSQTVFVQ
jgi:hypothetical protein